MSPLALAPCPQNVVQVPLVPIIPPPSPRAVAVSFYPMNTSDAIIQESIDLNIEFSVLPSSCPPNVPKVFGARDQYQDNFITTGVIKRNSNCVTISNWFQIVLAIIPTFYTLVWSSRVCPYFPSPKSTDISIIDNNGTIDLYVNLEQNPNNALYVFFCFVEKVDGTLINQVV